MSLPKWTNNQPQTLRVGDKDVIIPPNTGVLPSLLAIQMHPKYWNDPNSWNPSRWISQPTSSTTKSNSNTLLSQETIVNPAPGTYFPWSDGPQNCPGTKLSQVEFVAVIVCLLQNHRVNIIREPNETSEEATKRALAVTQDRDVQLLLRMVDPDKLRLEWKTI